MKWRRIALFGSLLLLLGSYLASQLQNDYLQAGIDLTYIDALYLSVPSWGLWLILLPVIRLAANRFRLDGFYWRTYLAFHFVIGLGLSAFKVAVEDAILSVRFPVRPISIFQDYQNILIYWVILGMVYGWRYQSELRQKQIQTAQLSAQLSQAQLQALKSQLNPHFLFNTLHAISALMHRDVNAADRMLAQLGDLLRYTLDNDAAQLVSLEQEISFIRRYLDIEQTRFQDRLTVDIHVDTKAAAIPVPNMILQPLVENAIRHGLAPKVAAGHLSICGKLSNGRLYIQVKDTGVGLDPDWSEGIGLSNTRSRLEKLYQERFDFGITGCQAGGTCVTLVLPLSATRDKGKVST